MNTRKTVVGDVIVENNGRLATLPRKLVCIACLFVFTCSLFTAAASLVLLFFGTLPRELTYGLWMRLGLFSFITGISGWTLQRTLSGLYSTPPPALTPTAFSLQSTAFHCLLLLAGLVFAATLVFPRLDAYPWAAPDEMHHLIVAKNLAVYGEYASGSPQAGFKRFDPYDSVGPAVILPVAASFRVFGVSVRSARIVMALFFLLVCIAVYWFVAPMFGRTAALLGLFLVPMAFSSIYLGRTLYGEVPAWCFFLWGLCVWRKTLVSGNAGLGLAAGILFGLAILCKSILILMAFPAFGVFVFDRLSHRRLSWPGIGMPLAGICIPLFTWLGVVSWFGTVGGTTGGTWGLYQHYLLFGLAPAWNGFQETLLMYPLTHLVLFAAILSIITLPFFLRHDPPSMLLLLTAGFFAYWWLCFTPGQLPRYLWYSYVTASLCLGISLNLFLQQGPMKHLRLSTALVLVLPFLSWTAQQAHEVHTNTEMQGDTALAEYVAGLPADTRIATTFPPLSNALLFFTGRTIDTGSSAETLLDTHDVVVIRDDRPPPARACKRIGPYLVIEPSEKQPL